MGPEEDGLELELDLDDAGGLDSGVEDVVVGGFVVGLGHAVDVVEEVLDGVRELVLIAPDVRLLDPRVRPQTTQSRRRLRRQRLALVPHRHHLHHQLSRRLHPRLPSTPPSDQFPRTHS